MNIRLKLDRQAVLRLLMGFPIQKPTDIGLVEVEAEQQPWQPLSQITMGAKGARVHARIGMSAKDMEVWQSETYEVFVHFSEASLGKAGPCHMSVKRYDRMPVHNWRHLQQMKNEIFGTEREAVELYPAESRLADNANQTHLWVMPEGVKLEIGWELGFVADEDEIRTFNDAPHNGRQEERQPGITVGDTMLDARRKGELDPEHEKMIQMAVSGELFS